VLDEDSLPIRMLGVTIDITKLKQTEDTLIEREAQLQAQYKAIPIPTFMWQHIDGDFLLISYNDAVEAFTYGRISEFVGVKAKSFYQDQPQIFDHLIQCFTTQSSIEVEMEYQFKHIDERKTLAVKYAFVPPDRIMVLTEDITERKNNEQIILDHERLKANFQKEQEHNALIQLIISTLSHDLKTPLTIILTSRDILSHYIDKLTKAKRQEKLDMIEHQIEFAIQLLDDTVQMMRGNAERDDFKPEEVNLDALCRISLDEVQSVYKTEHELHFTNSKSIEKAWVDEILVSRILMNLLSNAIKYSPDHSKIQLELDSSDQWIILRITDSGMGIATENLETIFDPFYRPPSVEHIAGTGLGLSIVKDCVDRHKGNIHVKSELNHGTVFTIELPAMMTVKSTH
jgi:signal transduction histidine kinase